MQRAFPSNHLLAGCLFGILAITSIHVPIYAQVPEGPVWRIDRGPLCDAPGGVRTPPVVAAAPTGTFLVLWERMGEEFCEIVGRLYDADGEPLGEVFALSSNLDDEQRNPDVAATPDGGFFAIWQQGPDEPSSIRVLPLSPTGESDDGGVIVFTPVTTGVEPSKPRIAIGSGGSAVAVWEILVPGASGPGLFGLFLADGVLGGLVLPPDSFLINPVAAVAPDGSFAIAWEDVSAFSDGEADLFVQIFDAGGKASSDPVPLNLATEGLQRSPELVVLDDGLFGAVWDGAPAEFFDGVPLPIDSGIFGRHVVAEEPVGAVELQLNSFIAGFQVEPAIAVGEDGGIFVAWNDDSAALLVPRFDDEVPRDRLSGQWMSPNGLFLGPQVRLDGDDETSPGSPVGRPAVASLGDHRWVVVWTVAGPDPSTVDVYARLFGPSQLYLDCIAEGICTKATKRPPAEVWR